MKTAAWRSIAEWKAALVTLPDGPFFDLMRGYLGDIRTPFNKQRLVDDLAGFLGRRDIQETAAAYLDATDRKVIAAVHRLAEPTAAELTSFFDGELSYAELHAVILNLEERLVIYRIEEEGVRRLALNPALESVLTAAALDAAPLFPSAARDPAAAAAWDEDSLDPLTLAATVSFLYRRSDLFKADRSIRKKAAEEASAVFAYSRFERAVAALRALGAIAGDEEGEGATSVRVCEEKLDAFAELPEEEKTAYLAAALCAVELGVDGNRGGEEAEEGDAASRPAWSTARTARERLASWARLLAAFLSDLDEDRAYPRTTLSRMLDIREREQAEGKRHRWSGRGQEAATELRAGFDPAAFRKAAIRALELARALVRGGEDAWSPAGAAAAPAAAGRPVISLDSSFSVVAYPEIGFAEALALARFLDVRECAQTTRFELTRESAVRGFDMGCEVEDMVGSLERLSGLTVAQNVLWSLREWKARYTSVAIHRGTVLVVSEERRYLVETEAVARLVARALAPGVYLLSVSDESEAVRALAKAGVDIVALPPAHAPRVSPDARFAPFPALGPAKRATPAAASARRSGAVPAVPAAAAELARQAEAARPTATDSPVGEGETSDGSAGETAGGGGAARESSVEERLAALRAALEKKNLPKDQRDELALRIDRRVVLAPSQLVAAAVRYEKLEAKGLDYVGKVRVAEQALATGSLVEIFWRGGRGEPNRALGAPLALEKTSGEVELVIDTAPRGERIRIAVGKISLLRRIKRSIFGE